MSVDFPAPFLPTRPITSPGKMSRSAPSSARTAGIAPGEAASADEGRGHHRHRRAKRERKMAAARIAPWMICTSGPLRLRIVSPEPMIWR